MSDATVLFLAGHYRNGRRLSQTGFGKVYGWSINSYYYSWVNSDEK